MVEAIDRELRLLSNDAMKLPTKVQLLNRIAKEEEFRRGLFLTHLQLEDTCGSHCMTMLLSTHSDSRFRKACTHAPPADCGAEPKTMVELVRERRGTHRRTATGMETVKSV